MFVLADIEWVTDNEGRFSPTQLAAIRVDENWNEVCRFVSFICPHNSELYDRNHVAYTGGTASDFLNAPKANRILKDFMQWLNEEDIILWWYKESDIVFRKIVKHILTADVQNKAIIIKDYVGVFLQGQEHSCGNAYKVSQARGIETNAQLKHYSINDATVMRMLMCKIAYPQTELLQPLPIAQKKHRSSKYEKSLPYQYDPSTNTIHLKDCQKLLNSDIVTQGFETWKTPLRKGFKPCDCCKDEYKKAFRERNKDILERTQYTYVYTADSKVFHKYSCGVMLSAKNILGAVKYETVIKTGKKPCKLCNPTPEDKGKPLLPQLQIAQSNKKAKQTLSKDSIRAINRQKVAVEERRQKLKDASLTEQEREDVYTLTQPRFAFWVGQGYQTFHLRNCSKLHRLSNLRGFATYKEAVSAGFTPCRKCRPTAKHDMKFSVPITNRVRKNEKIEDLESLCYGIGYSYYREGAYLCVETPVGKWKINVSSVPVKLEHINLVKTPKEKNYHEQPRIFLSFIDVFNYIKRHDDELEKKALNGKVFVKFIEKA